MSNENKIRKAFLKLAKDAKPFSVIAGTVKDVDTSDYTIDVDPADGGATYYKVRLKPVVDSDDHGFIAVPEKNSAVLVGCLMSNDNVRFVLQCSSVKTYLIKNSNGAQMLFKEDGVVEINGSNKGGIPVAQDIITIINQMKTIFNSHSHPSSGAPPTTPMVPPSTVAQIENQKAKHGS